MVSHAQKLAWCWGSRPPVFSIGHEEPFGPLDSGFTLLYDDAPDPGEVDEHGEHPALYMLCLHCLLEDHPEVGPGLDIARRHGLADLDANGAWVVGDLSRLDSTGD